MELFKNSRPRAATASTAAIVTPPSGDPWPGPAGEAAWPVPAGRGGRRATGSGGALGGRARARLGALARRLPRGQLAALMALAGTLNVWALARNGWANDYYSGAVRSMSTSWHDFLFASLDRSGVMTVDKPPLALWVQALSVRAFGYHPLSVLLPQAVMGVASVALLYDLVRRRFGRWAGFAAGLALALTPITVAISRHNNPDALLVLCSVAALWCAVRGLERGRLRWLVLAGVCVGLGFETKMGVALVVVPGIAAAWLWIAPAARGRLHALRQLLGAGAAMALVGGAWPALVELTPAADRPWISGTSDNRILSLIFEYNGLGRVDGQAGGPAGRPGGGPGGGGNTFGGSSGPLRLLNSALGGQAGWLLGFGLVSALGLLVATRLHRRDPRSGWLMVVGGAFATTAVLFSEASGIFHPYYVSLLAPFIAALVGAGAWQLLAGGRRARIFALAAVAAGVVVELVVRGDYPGGLPWLAPALLVTCGLGLVALLAWRSRAVQIGAVVAILAALLAAPAVWAVDTLGYATSGTFPAGGPASAETGGAGGPFGAGGGGPFGGAGRFGGVASGGIVPGPSPAGAAPGSAGAGPSAGVQLFGPGGSSGSGGSGGSGRRSAHAGGAPFGAPASGGSSRGPGAGSFAGPGPGPGAGGGPFGGAGSVDRYLAYVKRHGGGTIAVSSQSSAAAAITADDADVAGIGGFSGRESDVSVSWLAHQVSAGKIRWVLVEGSGEGTGGRAGGLPGDNRAGSKAAMAAVAEACRAVTVSSSAARAGDSGAGAASAEAAASAGTLYDCQGRAPALLRVADR